MVYDKLADHFLMHSFTLPMLSSSASELNPFKLSWDSFPYNYTSIKRIRLFGFAQLILPPQKSIRQI